MNILGKNGIVAAILLALLGLGSPPCQASEQTVSQRVDGLLSQGENQQAWLLLQELSEDGSGHEEVSWRMARTQYEMGRLVESDKKALEFFQEAENHARAL